MKSPLFAGIRSRVIAAGLSLLSLFGGSAAAGTLTLTNTAPTPGANDVHNLTGASSDAGNIDGGNDASTYVSFDRVNQGQTFTTGANTGGYALVAVWVRHVGYTSNTALTWYRQAAGSVLRARVTIPSAAGTPAFVVANDTYTFTGTEPNKLPEGVSNSLNGTGTWMRFAFASPVAVSASTQYGFDLSTPANQFFELLGTSSDSVAGGSAYRGGTNGNAGGPDNTLVPLTGDRVFLVELATVGSLPAIVSQPQGYSGHPGDNLTLSVSATGNPQPTFQWQRSSDDGANWSDIAGATSASLNLSPLAYTHMGLYRAVATNASGSVASETAAVSLTPKITGGSSSATVLDGSEVTLGVTAVGTGTLGYQWYFKGALLAGETGQTLALGPVNSADAGDYSVVVLDSDATAAGWSSATSSRSLDLTVIPSSAATIAYYRFEEGAVDSVITSATDTAGTNTLSSTGSPTYAAAPTPTVPRTGAANLGSARFPSTTSDNSLAAPITDTLATTPFTDFTVECYVRLASLGGWQTFIGRADSGNPGDGAGTEALFYLQKAGGVTGNGLVDAFRIELITKDDRNLQLHTRYVPQPGVWYHLAAVGDSVAGTLSLYVDGVLVDSVPGFNGLRVPPSGSDTPWIFGRGEILGNLAVDFMNGNLDEVRFSQVALRPSRFLRSESDSDLPPPTITAAPEHLTVRAGTAATFGVSATGAGELGYQWYKDGVAILSGGTSATLTLNNVSASDAGTYSVKVSDGVGGAQPPSTTVSATLQVVDVPLPSRAIGLNFVGAANAALNANYATDLGTLAATDSAGFLPVPNWNNSATATFVANSPAPLALVENAGAPGAASATWASALTWASLANGVTAASKVPDRRLFHGYIESRSATGATVSVSNIPYASYDVYVYVAGGGNGNVGALSIDRESAPTYYYRLMSHDAFASTTEALPYMLGASTTLSAAQLAPRANFVRFAAITGESFTVAAKDAATGVNAGGIAAIQIVDRTPAGAAYPPIVTAAPSSKLVKGGANVSFAVTAASQNSGTLSYQWQKDGSPISGQTSATLALNNVNGAASGNYSVVVTDTSANGVVTATRSASLVVVDATRSLLINGDLNTAGSPTFVGDGILRADEQQTPDGLAQGSTVWNGIVGAAGSATRALDRESTGLSLPGLSFAYANAGGAEDNIVYDVIDGSVSRELMRDYLYTDSQTTPLTATISGLQAFAGHRFTLLVYAFGKQTTSQGEFPAGTPEDGATIALGAANNHLGQGAQTTTAYLTAFTSENAARRVEINNLVTTASASSAYVVYSGVVAVDGTIAWSHGADSDGGRIPLNGFQLLLTADDLAPAAPSGLAAVAGDGSVSLGWNASAGATSYTIRRGTASGVYTTISAGAVFGTSYTDTAVVNGTTYYYVVAAANGIVTGQVSTEVSATPNPTLTAIQSWRQANFGTSANSGAAANTADPDGDGQTNLLEYALGTNPNQSGALPVAVSRSGDFLALGFSHVADPNLVYSIEASDDLATWNTVHDYPAFTTAGTATYTDAVALSSRARRFLRLVVSIQ